MSYLTFLKAQGSARLYAYAHNLKASTVGMVGHWIKTSQKGIRNKQRNNPQYSHTYGKTIAFP